MLDECPLPEGSLVIAYLRVSGDIQKERGTIMGQREELDRYVRAHKLRMAQPAFVDEAKAGSSVAPRDGFQAMLAFARQEPRPCDGIVFWSWSRFARDQDDAHFYKADLRRRGYTLISLSDGIPSDTGFDYVIESLIHWKDQEYLAQLAADTKRGLHLIARKGFAPGGFPPRGYKATHTQIDLGGKSRRVAQWVPDPAWAPAVKRAFEMKAHGATTKQILQETRLFNTTNSLTWFWRNKTYLGFRKCGDLEIPAAHEPLVSQELWDQVQARLHDRPQRGCPWAPGAHPKQKVSSYLLSGLIRCGQCGSAMIGSRDRLRSGSEFRFYVCGKRKRSGIAGCPSGKLNAAAVEDAVMGFVMGRLLRAGYARELLEATVAELNGQSEPRRRERARLERQLSEVNRAIYHLLNAVEKDGSQAARRRLQEREAEKHGFEADLRVLAAQARGCNLGIDDTVLEDALASLRATLTEGDVVQRRLVLRRFVVNIEAARDRAKLIYRFPLATGPIWQCPQRNSNPRRRLERAVS
jgi:site-specific DNA recombinase